MRVLVPEVVPRHAQLADGLGHYGSTAVVAAETPAQVEQIGEGLCFASLVGDLRKRWPVLLPQRRNLLLAVVGRVDLDRLSLTRLAEWRDAVEQPALPQLLQLCDACLLKWRHRNRYERPARHHAPEAGRRFGLLPHRGIEHKFRAHILRIAQLDQLDRHTLPLVLHVVHMASVRHQHPAERQDAAVGGLVSRREIRGPAIVSVNRCQADFLFPRRRRVEL